MKDGEMRSPTTPNGTKSILNKSSPTSPKESLIDKIPEFRSSNQSNPNRRSYCQTSEEQSSTSSEKAKEEDAEGSGNNSQTTD